jgi:hypothetical protein
VPLCSTGSLCGGGPRRSGRSGRANLHGAAGIIVLARPEAVRCANGGSIRLAEPVRPALAGALSGKNAAVTDTLARQPRSGDRTGRVGYELRERMASAVPMCQSVRCIGTDTLVSISTTTQRSAETPPRNDYVSPDELLASATAHQTCRPKPVCAAPSARPIPLPAALTTLGVI